MYSSSSSPLAASIGKSDSGVGMRRPVDIDHLFRDPDTVLPVLLIVTLPISVSGNPSLPQDGHWKLAWRVGRSSTGVPVQREILLSRGLGLQDFTNWGPITKTAESYTYAVEITTMTLANRRRLEKIAEETPVPRTKLQTCQQWITIILEKAERQGLLKRSEWTAAIMAILNA